MPLDAASSWITALPEVTDHPAAGAPETGAPPAAQAASQAPTPAGPSSFPIVAPHPAPDGSGTWTNLSDEDYAKFNAGISGPSQAQPPAKTDGAEKASPSSDKPSWITGLPEVVNHPAAASSDKSTQAQSTVSGIVNNLGAGTSDAVAATLGAPVDLVTSGINAGLRGVYGGARALNGLVGGQQPPAQAPQITNPVGGSDWFRSAEGLIGADPRNVVPAGEPEQIARAAGNGAASMALPWAGARALPALAGVPGVLQEAMGSGSAAGQAGIGAAAGAAGQGAEDVAPPPYKPLANMAGQMVGGGLVGAGATAARSVLGAGARQAGNFVAPLTEAGQQRLAGQRIAGAASDLSAVHDALNNPVPPLVPGSEPTTFQATGDQGLGNLERATAKNNPDQFIERSNAQNTARVAAIGGVQSAGDPDAIGAAFRSQLQELDQANEAVQAGARGNAQSALAAVGGTTTPQQSGEIIRGAVDTMHAPRVAAAETALSGAATRAQGAAGDIGNAPPVGADAQASALQRFGNRLQQGLDKPNQERKAAVSKLYAAVDPDGNLAVDMQPFRAAVKQIVSERPQNLGPMAGEAGQVFGTAQLQPAVQKFSEVGALRQRIGDAMATERRVNGQSQTYRYLTMLRSALDDTLSGAVAEKAAADAEAVKTGTMAPTDAIQSRLRELHASSGAETAAASDGAVSRGNDGGVQQDAGGPGAVSGVAGEHVPAQPGQGNARGRGAIPPGAATQVGFGVPTTPLAGSNRAPETLHDFLISKGGVKDESGEFKSQDLDRIHHRAGGRLINPKGMSHDYAREAAVEEGFLPASADVNDFRAAVQSKTPVYRISEAAEAARARQDALNARLNDEARYNARDAVSVAADATGVRMSPAEIEHATDLHMQGVHPDEAIRQATAATEDAALQRNAAANAFGSPGVPLAAQQASLGVPDTGLAPNFDEAALARRRAADAAHSERMQTFGPRVPGVGPVLQVGDRPGDFRMGASSVPATLFSPGKGGAERIQAFQKAAQDSPALVRDLQDYAAFSFRRAAEDADGTINAAKAQKWRDQHSEVMGAFPDLAKKFDTAVHARQAMDEAAARRDAVAQSYPLKPGIGDAEIAQRFFRPGLRGVEDVKQFNDAVGGRSEAVAALKDYAAWSLRQAAENADGTLDLSAYARWAKAHESALSAFPDLAAKFDTAAKARAALDEVVARHAEARKAYQTAAVSKLMGDADPVATVGRILNSDTALATMQDLARKTAGDPAARAGLRRAVVEHILNNLRSNALGGDERLLKNDAFQTFVRKTPAALRTIFSDAEVKNIQAVAEDMQRSTKSVSGTKLPGGSNTAQDLAAGAKHGSHGPSVLNSVIAAEVGGEMLSHAAGPIGKVVGLVITPVVNAMRASGMAKVDDLVTQAMLNPALAKTLLSKLPANTGSGRAIGKLIAGQIKALSGVAAVRSANGDQNK